MGDYTYKRVDESCYEDLVYLFKAAFNTKTTTDYYRGKMNTGYLGVTHLGYLAYDSNNKPAAFYGVFPYQMEYKGQLYLAAQSGDTMTHPQHTGKGLFTALGKMTYELAKKEGIQFIFGFPNENSYYGFTKKLDWIHTENTNTYTWTVFTFPCAAIARRIQFLKPLYNWYAQFVLGFYKSDKPFLSNSAISDEFGGVHRSKEFTDYKSFYANNLIDINGKTVWLKADGALLIGDMELKSDTRIEEVFAQTKRLAFLLGCNKVVFSVGKDTAWDSLLKGKTKCEEGMHVGYLDLQSGLPLDKFKFVFADSDTF